VGTNVTARGSLGGFKGACRALGGWQRAGSPHNVFSVLPVSGKGLSRIEFIQEDNACLSGWCHRQGFGFYDLGTVFGKQGIESRHGMHLTKWGESVLANGLANLALVLSVKECLEYTKLCLGTSDEPVRELVSRHKRTD